MRIFYRGKDGGRESTVWGFWLIEWKQLFSIVLLKFVGSNREAYHTHSFNCISWVVSGKLKESMLGSGEVVTHPSSWLPFITRRSTFHKVDSVGTSYVLTFRGPWNKT